MRPPEWCVRPLIYGYPTTYVIEATEASFEGDFIVKLTFVLFCYILLCEVKRDRL